MTLKLVAENLPQLKASIWPEYESLLKQQGWGLDDPQSLLLGIWLVITMDCLPIQSEFYQKLSGKVAKALGTQTWAEFQSLQKRVAEIEDLRQRDIEARQGSGTGTEITRLDVEKVLSRLDLI